MHLHSLFLYYRISSIPFSHSWTTIRHVHSKPWIPAHSSFTKQFQTLEHSFQHSSSTCLGQVSFIRTFIVLTDVLRLVYTKFYDFPNVIIHDFGIPQHNNFDHRIRKFSPCKYAPYGIVNFNTIELAPYESIGYPLYKISNPITTKFVCAIIVLFIIFKNSIYHGIHTTLTIYKYFSNMIRIRYEKISFNFVGIMYVQSQLININSNITDTIDLSDKFVINRQ